jgi:hypothetical protein
VAAFFEKDLGMCFLKISGAYLAAQNMRGDCNHRSIAPMSIEKAVDEVEVPGTSGTRAGGELPGELGLSPRRKRTGFFVTHMDPFKLAIQAQSVRNRIQAVADDAVYSFDTRLNKPADQLIRYPMWHRLDLLSLGVVETDF